jgi:hypothetical protein
VRRVIEGRNIGKKAPLLPQEQCIQRGDRSREWGGKVASTNLIQTDADIQHDHAPQNDDKNGYDQELAAPPRERRARQRRLRRSFWRGRRSRTRTHLMERELYGGTRILFLQGPNGFKFVCACRTVRQRVIGSPGKSRCR